MIIRGYTPHSGQQVLHKKLLENYFYYTFNIGRQWGKTALVINQMLKWAFEKDYTDIAFISPTLKQSKRVLQEIIKMNNGSKFIHFNKSDLTASFVNGSVINFFSSEQGDNIRGYHFHYVVRDESAFQPNDFFGEVVNATLLAKGIKSIDISTPKGRNSDHFKRYSQGINTPDLYYSYTAPSSSNPYLNKVILDDIKKQVPDHIFRQEYLAEFLDGGLLFKNIEECINNTPKQIGRNYGGLDIGRADDYTVLTICNEEGQMLFVKRWRQLEWHTIVDEVAKYIKQFDAHTFVEVNNQGDVVFELLQKKVRNLVFPFVTTNTSKSEIIENLIVLFDTKQITIFDNEWLKMELESFSFNYSATTRRVTYSAPQGLHDDGVMSLAICHYSRKQNKVKGIYY